MKKKDLSKLELMQLKGGISSMSFEQVEQNGYRGIGCKIFGGACKTGCRIGCVPGCKEDQKNGITY